MNRRIAGRMVVVFWGVISIFLLSCASRSPFLDQADRAIAAWADQQEGVTVIYTLSELPVKVRDHFGEIADRNGRFNSGCVQREGVPGKRFLVAARKENAWRVAAEAGGFAYQWYFTDFTLNSAGDILETRRIDPRL